MVIEFRFLDKTDKTFKKNYFHHFDGQTPLFTDKKSSAKKYKSIEDAEEALQRLTTAKSDSAITLNIRLIE